MPPPQLPDSSAAATPAAKSPAAKPSAWNISYRTRLLIGVCGLVLLTGTAVTWLAFRSARASTRTMVDALFREVSSHAVTHTRGFVQRAAPLVESLRQLADRGLAVHDSELLAPQLLAILEGNPGLSWVSYGDEDGTFTGAYRPVEGGMRINQSKIVSGRTLLVEFDVLPDHTRKLKRREEDSGYDPRVRPYRKAKKEGRLVWLPPYVFFNQGVPGISCAAPVYESKGKLRGVVSIDFDLKALSEFVAVLSMSEHSKVFLFTADEVLLAHPNQRNLVAQGSGAAGELLTLRQTGDPLVEAFRRHMNAGPGASVSEPAASGDSFRSFGFVHEGTDYLASATTFQLADDLTWVVGAVAPAADFLGEVGRGQALALAVAAAALLIGLVLAFFLARRVSGPVLGLINFMGQVGAGDLEARADFGGSREFRQLSEALNLMIADLRDRVRLRHSLDVAMQVQQRLLPQRSPQARGLDVAGHSTYCDETGGDYYDFLILDETAQEQLLVALGDVMGHGVAAALVMAGARAVLRDRADKAGSLTELMGRLNRLLAADLEGTRFMTMHLAVVDARARTYRWVSAGHDPAILYDAATDRFEELAAGDIPLGIMEEQEYTEHTFGPLLPGQVVLIGTDGVWEMPNAQEEQFGKDRLRAVIRESASQSAEQIVHALRDRLIAFRGDHHTVDDVTFVVIKVQE